MTAAKWKLPDAPPPKCEGLCLDPDSDDYDAEQAEAVLQSYWDAVESFSSTTGRFGLCPWAARYCVPVPCLPCRCRSKCGHFIDLPLPGDPAAGPCCYRQIGEPDPVPVGDYAPTSVWLDGRPVTGWLLGPSCIRIPVDAARGSGALGEPWTGKPAYDGAGGWTAPTSGLVVAGYFGVCPTRADLRQIAELSCRWAREDLGVCLDRDEAAHTVTQSGPDGSVTHRRSDRSSSAWFTKNLPNETGSGGAVGLSILSASGPQVTHQFCEL